MMVPASNEGERTKSITSINYEEECRETATVENGCFHVRLLGFLDVRVVSLGKDMLRAESLGGTYSRENLLSKSTTVGNIRERQPESIA